METASRHDSVPPATSRSASVKKTTRQSNCPYGNNKKLTAALNRSKGVADGVRPRGARRGYRVVYTPEPVRHADVSRRHVAQDPRHEERRHAAELTRMKQRTGVCEVGDVAHAGSHGYPAPCQLGFSGGGWVPVGVFEGFVGRGERQAGERRDTRPAPNGWGQ